MLLLAVACWLPSSTCWLPSPAYWLLPVGFHIYLACLFSLSPAGWLSPAGIHLPPADLRLLASCSLWLACLFSLACWLSPAGIHLPPADFRLLDSCSRPLAVARWLPPLACPLSYAGCRLLASCSRLLAVACWVPPPAGSLSHAGCRLLAASIFHLLAFTFCFLFLAAPLGVKFSKLSSQWCPLVTSASHRSQTARLAANHSDREGACNSSWLTRGSRASSTSCRRPPPAH